jgi:hypothetical protein
MTGYIAFILFLTTAGTAITTATWVVMVSHLSQRIVMIVGLVAVFIGVSSRLE